MTQDDKRLLRLAIAIHEQLLLKQGSPTSLEIPTETWRQSEVLLGRLKQAQRRGWRLAAERLRRDLRTTLERLGGDLTGLSVLLEQPSASARQASIRDIYADLLALREEFEDISFDLPQRTLSVTTEAIQLERVYLGPFEIRLDWSDLAHGHPRNYRVIALDAHPAENNESVTHPARHG